MARIGYARVSTKNQNDDSQVDELNAHGVDKLFVDHRVSGDHASGPHLDAAQELVRILLHFVEAVQVRLSSSGEPDEARGISPGTDLHFVCDGQRIQLARLGTAPSRSELSKVGQRDTQIAGLSREIPQAHPGGYERLPWRDRPHDMR